ncbi:MAG: cupin domain-containing protein [bacterium]|nr:cupin domain-containing protein [bacterium]
MSYLDLNQVEEKELIPGFHVKFVHTNNMTFAYWRIEAGSALPYHSHHHEQVANLIEGEMEFNLDGEIKKIAPGDVVVIPPNVSHSGKAITECRIIDVFHPAREDYK